ncbi:DNA adenine methylase [Chondromyces apiculatus]|uniref:Site-specific DNA-methyltransferase (adenine-specific) n=1 Tax=Chondromyces apiculatus DSM 436 TaxID=1192034 RepID=A0A017SYZ8_9BACT|nr:DNA adenine methylase [Chondromyces apiculatus]EYF02178.1 Methyl-directed repair DNA adenine methylase [Chondromyces apiculatus DSM 436]
MPTSSAAVRLVEERDDAPRARPFLKWVGGKGQLLDQYRPLFPKRFGRYFEPFVGGAAVFFHLRTSTSVDLDAALTDVNEELVNCYRVVRDEVEPLIQVLQGHRYDRDHYYAVRGLEPRDMSHVERAARTVFLNRSGFNGLYRVNQEGRFNVPFGRFTKPKICDAENLRTCSSALRGVHLAVRDFSKVADDVNPGDFVYLDPPYPPVSATANFTSYIPGGFNWADQLRLYEVFCTLAQKRAFVMLSCSDVPQIRHVYRDFSIDSVQASRSINSRATGRGKVGEIVVRNY